MSYASYDLEVDLSFLVRRVQDVRQEGDHAQRNVEANTVLVPLLLVGQSLHQETLVLIDLLQRPVVETVSGSGSLVGVVDRLVLRS
jgi:hypothetical protein